MKQKNTYCSSDFIECITHGEIVHLDVACSMYPKPVTRIDAVSPAD